MGSVISPPINFDVKKANDGQLMQVVIAASNYKQLSVGIEICNYKIKTSFVGPEMPKA